MALAQADPASLPARDQHNGLLVAAEPYQDAARCKERFGKKNPCDAGILVLEVFFRNDNDKAVRVNLDAVRLVLTAPGANRQRLVLLSPDDVADIILSPEVRDPTASRRPLPIPKKAPKKRHSKEWEEVASSVRAVGFEMTVLPPRATVHGFLYFDLDRRFDLLAYAALYLPDLKFLPDNQALLFFEVDLGKARSR